MNADKLPTLDEIRSRMHECREELKALKKLARMIQARDEAEQARQRRQSIAIRKSGA